MTCLAIVLIALTVTIPPAAKVLAVSVAVYALLQGLKKAPWFQSILVGWWSVLFNVVFSILGVVVVTPVDQLYTLTTLTTVLQAIGTAAGIHGTVTLMKQQAQESTPQQPPKNNG